MRCKLEAYDLSLTEANTQGRFLEKQKGIRNWSIKKLTNDLNRHFTKEVDGWQKVHEK